MAAISNLTIYDGATTPVAHVFVAEGISREGGSVVCKWREVLSAVPDYAQCRMEARLTVLKSGTRKIEWKVVVPVMEAVLNQNAAGYTAAPKVAYEDTEMWTTYAHQRSTVAGRRLARMILVNVSNNVGTSVPAATGGTFADLFDSLVSPV